MLDRILVVDDEPIVRQVIGEVLSIHQFHVVQAGDGPEALDLLDREPFTLVLCDIRMPGMDGFELLREIRRGHPGIDVIMMTGYGSIDGAVDAMSMGAADYLIKPLKPKEIVARIRTVIERRRLEEQIHHLQSQLRTRHDLSQVVAESPRMNAVLSSLRRIAPLEDHVHLTGEPGTGREFLAQAIHYASLRRDEPIECVRCETVNPERFPGQLFGQKQDGGRARRGLLEQVEGGTLFLHHLESLPIALQEEIGQLIEQGGFTRRGGERNIPLRARIITSTETPVTTLLDEGKLSGALAPVRSWVSIAVPPLRQRIEDLPRLVEGFVSRFEIDNGQRLQISHDAIQALEGLDYETNVSQLFAILTHSAGMAPNGEVTAEQIAKSARQGPRTPEENATPMSEQLGDREYQLVVRAIQRHPRRLDQAAKELGVSRTTLWRRMRKYGIKTSDVF